MRADEDPAHPGETAETPPKTAGEFQPHADTAEIRSATADEPGPRTEAFETSSAPGIPDLPAAPETLDARLQAEAAERRRQGIDAICAGHGIDAPDAIAAVERAYDVVADNHAPFITAYTERILDACREHLAKAPGTVIAFVSRDGDSLALAAYELDRNLFDSHCTLIAVPRARADAAVQDVETHTGRTFDELAPFRATRTDVDPEEIPGARARLTNHVESRGVPVATPGADVIIVDSSFKGTVQELLTALYPDLNVHGHYLFLGQARGDPHPDSKTGHALHLPADASAGDATAPDSPFAIFTEKDAVLTIEHILRGSMGKTRGYDEDGRPIRQPESPRLDRLDPAVVSQDYTDAAVRLAVMDAGQLAVANYARYVADLRDAGGDSRGELSGKAENFARQVRSWVTGTGSTDPAFAELMDSFVPRSGGELADLRTAVDRAGLDDTAAASAWRDYPWLGSPDDKKTYVADFHRQYPQSRGADDG
ncbi:hypothetical protein [Nocardia sp. BMG51109]|uniref:hypothetical protein n=1 Tax=Nocardia sp. BMG51109 TaxID=1056816 RepID=UPI000465EAA9|nr:hypothetical protein [Nocardia sp. BMG51109]